MDKERFQQACQAVLQEGKRDGGIGTLAEKSIHAVLKHYYEPYADSHEMKVGGCVADIIGENGVIEIQTRQFSRLRAKLEAFLPAAHVTVVYPVILRKRLNWIDPLSGELASQGKFFRTGTLYSLFPELYRIKSFLRDPRLSFRVVALEAEEYRLLNGNGPQKRNKAEKVDKIPTALLDELILESPQDFLRWIPESCPEIFTSKEFAKHARISVSLAQVTLNVLTELQVVIRCGKEKRSILYCRAEFLTQNTLFPQD